MVQFTSYLRRVLCKMRLIFPRINGPSVSQFAPLCLVVLVLSLKVFSLNLSDSREMVS